MSLFIELFLTNDDGQVMCIADQDGRACGEWPIPDSVVIMDKADPVEAAEDAFEFFNFDNDHRGMSVGDYLSITEEDVTNIFRCESMGWSVLCSDGQWERV